MVKNTKQKSLYCIECSATTIYHQFKFIVKVILKRDSSLHSVYTRIWIFNLNGWDILKPLSLRQVQATIVGLPHCRTGKSRTTFWQAIWLSKGPLFAFLAGDLGFYAAISKTLLSWLQKAIIKGRFDPLKCSPATWARKVRWNLTVKWGVF